MFGKANQMSKIYLFVYGTLRKDFALPLKEAVAKDMEFIGTGRVKATLYDLGAYPGAVKEGGSEIVGDVFELRNETVLAVLDEYEGNEYRREMEAVTLSSGGIFQAWMYWYTGITTGSMLIKNDDYLHYLKNKKDRFV
jgi:gamma-glutamylcyclotransferase (GGCT)/AIG2-like uncharacterized protein YtfP